MTLLVTAVEALYIMQVSIKKLLRNNQINKYL